MLVNCGLSAFALRCADQNVGDCASMRMNRRDVGELGRPTARTAAVTCSRPVQCACPLLRSYSSTPRASRFGTSRRWCYTSRGHEAMVAIVSSREVVTPCHVAAFPRHSGTRETDIPALRCGRSFRSPRPLNSRCSGSSCRHDRRRRVGRVEPGIRCVQRMGIRGQPDGEARALTLIGVEEERSMHLMHG